MKYLLSICILLFFCMDVVCQDGFNQSYLVDSQMTRFVQIIETGHELVVVGERFEADIGIWGILIAKFDTTGQLLIHRVYLEPELTFPIVTTRFRPILHTSDNKLLVAGVMVPNNQLFLLKVDMDLNLEFLRFYPENYGSYYISSILENDGHYYLCGEVQNFTFHDDGFVIKLDLEGNVIQEKTYGISTSNEGIAKAAWSSDTTILIAGGSSTFPHPDDEDDFEGQNWIFEVDTSGQILWEWRSEINPDHGGIRSFKKLDDGGWIMVTYPRHPDELNYVHTSGGLIRTDASFNTIWFQEWGIPLSFYTSFNDLILTQDGKLVY